MQAQRARAVGAVMVAAVLLTSNGASAVAAQDEPTLMKRGAGSLAVTASEPGAITGIVSSSLGSRLEGVEVSLLAYGFSAGTTTDHQGAYVFHSLPAGEYMLYFDGSALYHVSEYYDDALHPGDATPVPAVLGVPTTDIDAVLEYITVCSEAGGTGPFKDVDADHLFCLAIEWLERSGISGGYPDGTFGPALPLTRQGMAAFLRRAFDEGGFTAPSTPTFSDVPTDHLFYEDIEWLAASGITAGYPDGTFRPTLGLSRQGMAAFLKSAFGAMFTAPSTPTFSDVPTDHLFYEDIEWLAFSQITGGYTDGTFRPSALLTRQAMAAFLFRALSGLAF